MIHAVLPYLTCPQCRRNLAVETAQVRCSGGHAYDLARAGYVTLATGRAASVSGDNADMVQARDAFLAAGHYTALAEQLTAAVNDYCPGGDPENPAQRERVIVDLGAGTGYYLAHLLRAFPEAVGVAVDRSRYALRRAARAHPRIGAIGVDLRGPLPVHTGVASVVLDVFAPRNATETRRVLRPDGILVVVTPSPNHLTEIIGPLGLLTVDPNKAERLREKLSPTFVRHDQRTLDLELSTSENDLVNLVMMGPTARHRQAAEIRSTVTERWPSGARISASFTMEIYGASPE